jgi:BMFP domain-containing protein YqiC
LLNRRGCSRDAAGHAIESRWGWQAERVKFSRSRWIVTADWTISAPRALQGLADATGNRHGPGEFPGQRPINAFILGEQTALETPMTQTSNRFFDEMARLMNDAASAAQGVRREFDTLVRTQAERILNDLDVVKREEFEAVKEMARLAREENEALKERVAALEAKMAKRD